MNFNSTVQTTARPMVPRTPRRDGPHKDRYLKGQAYCLCRPILIEQYSFCKILWEASNYYMKNNISEKKKKRDL